MKYFPIISNAVLLIAVAVLFYLHFSDENIPNQASPQDEGATSTSQDIEIAYINSDSLLNKYQFFIDKAEALEKKRDKFEAEFSNRAQGLQNEIASFQQTARSMTINQAKAMEEQLMKKQRNLAKYQENLTQQLIQDENKLTDELYERLSEYLKQYGANKDLQLVLTYTKGSGVLYAKDSLDITSEVVSGLNQAYSSENEPAKGKTPQDTVSSAAQ